MTPDQVVAIVRPGDTVLMLTPEDVDVEDATRWAETLRGYLPGGCRVGLIGGGIRLAIVQPYPDQVPATQEQGPDHYRMTAKDIRGREVAAIRFASSQVGRWVPDQTGDFVSISAREAFVRLLEGLASAVEDGRVKIP